MCLKEIKNHFRKYCNTAYKNSGFNGFWSIENSTEFIYKIKDIKAKSIHCFDFSTLYTNLPIGKVKEALSKLIVKVFSHHNCNYITINKYMKTARWTNNHSKDYNYINLTLLKI